MMTASIPFNASTSCKPASTPSTNTLVESASVVVASCPMMLTLRTSLLDVPVPGLRD